MEKGRDYIGVGVGAIFVDRGRVLLLKRRKEPESDCWGIQGGAVKFGETIEYAVKRELKEELSVEVELVSRHNGPRPAPRGRTLSISRFSGENCLWYPQERGERQTQRSALVRP